MDWGRKNAHRGTWPVETPPKRVMKSSLSFPRHWAHRATNCRGRGAPLPERYWSVGEPQSTLVQASHLPCAVGPAPTKKAFPDSQVGCALHLNPLPVALSQVPGRGGGRGTHPHVVKTLHSLGRLVCVLRHSCRCYLCAHGWRGQLPPQRPKFKGGRTNG